MAAMAAARSAGEQGRTAEAVDAWRRADALLARADALGFTDLVAQLRRALDKFPGVRPVPFSIIALLIGILLPAIRAEFQVSDSMLGLLAGTAFALFYVTLGIPVALIADRWNRRNLIAWAVAIWSGMTALSGFAANFAQLALARVGVGIGEAGCSPPAHSMIADSCG